MLRLVTSCAIIFVLGGCANKGMDLAQCRTADWRAIGYEDGNRGRNAAVFGAHRKNCAGHGVTPNFEAYMTGHSRGIAEFCRPRNAYRLGTSGYRYGGACPVGLEAAFLDAHADGYGLYQRRVSVNRLRKRISRKHRRSKSIEQLLAKNTAALVSSQTPPSRRLFIGVEIKHLTEERIDIERSISELEIELEQARSDYQSYSKSLAHP